MTYNLGFIGTGTISDAVIRGICTSEIGNSVSIMTSSRNQQIAQKLASDFNQIRISDNNQLIVTNCDLIFIALRRQILQTELEKLNFKPHQLIISFVPTISRDLLAKYTKCNIEQIYRAVPLPFIAQHQGKTPIYPEHKILQNIFTKTGGIISAKDEQQLDVFMLGGSMMGIYFKFAGICANWLKEQGLEKEQANLYISQLFNSLARQSLGNLNPDFIKLQQEFSTKGGTNEMITSLFDQQNGSEFFTKIFNTVLRQNE